MTEPLHLGFIGFGEAAFHIASGLRRAGLQDIRAYDINARTAGMGERIRRRAADAEVTLVESNAVLASACGVLLSTVTADQAVKAAEQTAPFLERRHVYADLNSVSPEAKRSVATVIEIRGAQFVEVAIMSPVAPHGHRVPMFLSGPRAPALLRALDGYGMQLEIVSEEIGAASAIKMCRSVVVKGLEALLLECAIGAAPYGAADRVFATLDETFPGMQWKKLAGYMISRVAEHGARRARELEEVAAMLRSNGIDPIMAEATVRRQDWCAGLNLPEHFGGKLPTDCDALVGEILRPR